MKTLLSVLVVLIPSVTLAQAPTDDEIRAAAHQCLGRRQVVPHQDYTTIPMPGGKLKRVDIAHMPTFTWEPGWQEPCQAIFAEYNKRALVGPMPTMVNPSLDVNSIAERIGQKQ
jgi:hypothetical protein